MSKAGGDRARLRVVQFGAHRPATSPSSGCELAAKTARPGALSKGGRSPLRPRLACAAIVSGIGGPARHISDLRRTPMKISIVSATPLLLGAALLSLAACNSSGGTSGAGAQDDYYSGSKYTGVGGRSEGSSQSSTNIQPSGRSGATSGAAGSMSGRGSGSSSATGTGSGGSSGAGTSSGGSSSGTSSGGSASSGAGGSSGGAGSGSGGSGSGGGSSGGGGR
jgi:hypothetical protein